MAGIAPNTSRRAMLGAITLAPVIATAAIGSLRGCTPQFEAVHAQFWAAYHALNASTPANEDALDEAYSRAYDDMRDVTPKTDREFVLKFIALYSDGGNPIQQTKERMVAEARHVVREGR